MWFIGAEVEQDTSAPPPKKILDPRAGIVKHTGIAKSLMKHTGIVKNRGIAKGLTSRSKEI